MDTVQTLPAVAAAAASVPPTVARSSSELSDTKEKLEPTPSKAEDEESVDDAPVVHDFPLRWKLIALCMGVFLSVGSSFSENTLGPLKSTLRKELDITNAQYGAISSASSLVNTILPIVGGCLLDYYGIDWVSVACSTFIFLGALISASGSNVDSFPLVMAGRIILGFGSTVIETCTSKILAHWFQHRGLGLVYGIDISFGKLIVLAAKAAAVPMSKAGSFWGWALWIPTIVCFLNLLQNLFYVWWVRSLPDYTIMDTGKRIAERRLARAARLDGQASGTTQSTTAWKHVLFPDIRSLKYVPRMFWVIVLTQTLQAGTVGGFNGLSADIITETRGSTAELAGYTSSVQQVIPILLTPSLGFFFDMFGYRMFFVSFVSALWCLVYSLIGYTTVNALGVMVISSLAAAFNALPFLASIPLIVNRQTELGLALGVWKVFNNSGSVIVDMIAGKIQDITPGNTYRYVVAFFIAVKALEFCLGLFYGILDRRYLAGILTMSERRRFALEAEGLTLQSIGRKPAKFATRFGLTFCVCLIIIAWVLFVMFSL